MSIATSPASMPSCAGYFHGTIFDRPAWLAQPPAKTLDLGVTLAALPQKMAAGVFIGA